MDSSRVTLVIGGARSGKSTYAENLAKTYQGERCYIATAEPFDEEMNARIARHKRDRGDAFGTTIEEPLDLAGALRQIPTGIAVVLIDCVTVWMGNLLFHRGIQSEPYPEVRAFIEVLHAAPCDVIVVTNETGLGIVPGDAESRAFRDHAGWLNQDLAATADVVVWMVAGIPVVIKGVLRT
jgi:adenosylcobinamide kinase / adenosylcobinamide-phosphate guanylyltransferase